MTDKNDYISAIGDVVRRQDLAIGLDIPSAHLTNYVTSAYAQPPQPTKIILAYPDTIECRDKEGNIHTYSLTEILDGLTRMARNGKKRDAKKGK